MYKDYLFLSLLKSRWTAEVLVGNQYFVNCRQCLYGYVSTFWNSPFACNCQDTAPGIYLPATALLLSIQCKLGPNGIIYIALKLIFGRSCPSWDKASLKVRNGGGNKICKSPSKQNVLGKNWEKRAYCNYSIVTFLVFMFLSACLCCPSLPSYHMTKNMYQQINIQ